jgi:hypothetical protein
MQTVLLSAIFSQVYLRTAFPPDLPYEGYSAAPEGSGDDRPQHHITLSENKIESIGKADGVFVMQGATAASRIIGPPSNMCHVDGEFTVFLTLLGRAPLQRASVFRVYGSAVIDGEVTMVQVQLHLDPQPDGSVDAVAAVGQFSALVKRPRGSDQVSYVVQRTSQNLTLMAFTPTSSEAVSASSPCTLALEPSVSTPMTINTTDESVGTLVEFGIYSKAVAAEEMNTLVSDLKRRALLTNSIVATMADREQSAVAAMAGMVSKNPWGSQTIDATCSSSIKDWTKPNFALSTEECRASIAQHCEAHTKAEGCECWDRDLPSYKLPSCGAYRELFSGKAVTEEDVVPPAAPSQPLVLPPTLVHRRAEISWLDAILG